MEQNRASHDFYRIQIKALMDYVKREQADKLDEKQRAVRLQFQLTKCKSELEKFKRRYITIMNHYRKLAEKTGHYEYYHNISEDISDTDSTPRYICDDSSPHYTPSTPGEKE